jgi:hypothetical protein
MLRIDSNCLRAKRLTGFASTLACTLAALNGLQTALQKASLAGVELTKLAIGNGATGLFSFISYVRIGYQRMRFVANAGAFREMLFLATEWTRFVVENVGRLWKTRTFLQTVRQNICRFVGEGRAGERIWRQNPDVGSIRRQFKPWLLIG